MGYPPPHPTLGLPVHFGVGLAPPPYFGIGKHKKKHVAECIWKVYGVPPL